MTKRDKKIRMRRSESILSVYVCQAYFDSRNALPEHNETLTTNMLYI